MIRLELETRIERPPAEVHDGDSFDLRPLVGEPGGLPAGLEFRLGPVDADENALEDRGGALFRRLPVLDAGGRVFIGRPPRG